MKKSRCRRLSSTRVSICKALFFSHVLRMELRRVTSALLRGRSEWLVLMLRAVRFSAIHHPSHCGDWLSVLNAPPCTTLCTTLRSFTDTPSKGFGGFHKVEHAT